MTKKKKILKITLIVVAIGIVIAGGVGYYMFNMPHRDVSNASTDYTLNASEFVAEYLNDPQAADNKYLDEEGESKIIEVTGIISDIDTDFAGNTVLILKKETDKAGVSCTFTEETNSKTNNLKVGDIATVKGVIRSGAVFIEALDMYENIILEKCDLL